MYLVAYTTHLMMGVASIGTGAMGCISFFVSLQIQRRSQPIQPQQVGGPIVLIGLLSV